MIGQALNIATLGSQLLAAVEQHFAPTDNPLPERRGIVPGEPRTIAWDCEQLTVSLVGIGWGQALDAASPSPQAGGSAKALSLRHAVLAVTLVRCTPSPTRNGPPTMEKLNAAGLGFLRDAGMLSQAVAEFVTRLRQGLGPESLVQPGAVEPVGPSGGFQGLECTLAITAAKLE